MRPLGYAVVAGLALAAACASGSDAGEASNEAVGPGKAGSASGGKAGSAGSGATGGTLPDAGSFPEAGPMGGAGGGAGGPSGGTAGSAGLAGSSGSAGSGAAAGGGSGGTGAAGGAGSGGAPGGSGGASGATGGAGSAGAPCVPQCTGKQCGTDGCTGSCGACGPAQSCNAGKCEDTCLATWKTPLSGITPSRIVVDAGVLYVAGKKGNQGYLGAYDACTGKETASQTTLVGSSSKLISVQLSATHVFAAGDGANIGLLVRAQRGSLALEASDPLVGSTSGDEVWDATPTPAGNLWMTGVAGVNATPGFWGIQGPIGGAACGFPVFSGTTGLGRAAVTGGGKVFVVGQRGQDGVVARFSDQSCAAVSPCQCTPEQSVSIQMGPAATELRHATYANGKLFVVGYGSDGTNSVSFLSRLDPNDLSTEATYQLDPSSIADAFLAVTVDSGIAYVGGLKAWQGDASFATATGQMLAIPAGFGPGTQPLWVHEPPGGHVVWGLSAQGGAVFASLSASDGVLMKCAAAGCP